MKRQDVFIIYLHGFLSSPQSIKAQQTIRYCETIGVGDRLLVPELSGGPAATYNELQKTINSLGEANISLIGSSLGGFYATCLAEANQLKAVIINPAVRPYEYWREYIGEHKNYYSGKVHKVTEQHVEELRNLDSGNLKYPHNYMLLAQKGDEVLDYRQAEVRYQAGTCIIQEGGSHSFENYADYLSTIFGFLTIKN